MAPPNLVTEASNSRKLSIRQEKLTNLRDDDGAIGESRSALTADSNRKRISPYIDKSLNVRHSSAFAKTSSQHSPASVLEEFQQQPDDDESYCEQFENEYHEEHAFHIGNDETNVGNREYMINQFEERLNAASPPAMISSSRSSCSSPSCLSKNSNNDNHQSSSSVDYSKYLNGQDSSQLIARQGLNLRLLPLIAKKDWENLESCLITLQQNASPHDIQIALTMTNVQGQTPLHAAAAAEISPDLYLSILELVPDENRDEHLLKKDEAGEDTPLHLACAYASSSDFTIIKNLILLAPLALEETNDLGDTPLHSLMKSQAFQTSQDFSLEAAAEEAVASLIQMAEHLATYHNTKTGATILHLAIAKGVHELVIMKLLEIAPLAAQLQDHEGSLPIHRAAAVGTTPYVVVARLIEKYPESILCRNMEGDTPLHVFMIHGNQFIKEDGHVSRNTTKIAELLVGMDQFHKCPYEEKEDSESDIINSPLLIRNNESLGPLHTAVLFDTPPQLSRLLMKHVQASDQKLWHQAAELATAFGATALHLACATASSSSTSPRSKSRRKTKGRDALATIDAMATPEVCQMPDDQGRTPLIVAVQNSKLSKKVVSALVKAYPKSVRLCTADDGYLPLHLAVQSKKARKKIVKILIKAYPESVYAVTTHSINTPLHEACSNKAPLDVVKYLVEKNELALEETNRRGKTPLEVAKKVHASKKVVEFLKEAQVKRNEMKEEASRMKAEEERRKKRGYI